MTIKMTSFHGLRALIALVALSAMFALPATAFGQNIGGGDCTPTDVQYAAPSDTLDCSPGEDGGDEVDGEIAGVTASGDEPVEDTGSLPFTGLDALTLLAVAAALTGTGLVLRRLTTSPGGGHGS